MSIVPEEHWRLCISGIRQMYFRHKRKYEKIGQKIGLFILAGRHANIKSNNKRMKSPEGVFKNHEEITLGFSFHLCNYPVCIFLTFPLMPTLCFQSIQFDSADPGICPYLQLHLSLGKPQFLPLVCLSVQISQLSNSWRQFFYNSDALLNVDTGRILFLFKYLFHKKRGEQLSISLKYPSVH